MATPTPIPPVAPRVPHPIAQHGEARPDDYFWMRHKQDPRVLEHLARENAYADAMTLDQRPLETALYAEMLARIQQTDLSAPYRKGAFLYYTRTEVGEQYPLYCRRRGGMGGPEELLLDLNALAHGHAFMALGAFEVSPDGRRLAYTIDDTGYRQYGLRVKDLTTGKELADRAERVTSIAWTADGATLFYTQEDPVAKRSYRLYRHPLGGEDTLIREEADERFDLDVATSRSEEWLIETRASHTTSEVAVLPSGDPLGPWRIVAPRAPGIEYYVDHRGREFWIRTNDRGKNFRLVTTPVAAPDPSHGTEVRSHRPDVMIAAVQCFEDHIVLIEREDGLPQLTVLDPVTQAARRVRFDEVAYTVGPGQNAEFDAPAYRYTYQSFLTPPSVYDLDLTTLESTLLKRTEVLGGWDPLRYTMERMWATAADGTRVPISFVSLAGVPRDGSAPCLLYGYGSYGSPSNVLFGSNRFSLLDRGMVYAIAHVRGGGEFGETWHEAGRMANKMNTFTDFIACAETLVEQRVTSADRLVIEGGSAGGLLVGAVAHLRPDRFRGVIAHVPFVDVINTMNDESLPLTVAEFEEWGNPAIAEQYAWLRAYSPYDNLRSTSYPRTLVRTSLNDSQVGFWEGAKYVARLRDVKTDPHPVLLKCNLAAGHGGASGRYDALHDVAFDLAWILTTVGLADARPATSTAGSAGDVASQSSAR